MAAISKSSAFGIDLTQTDDVPKFPVGTEVVAYDDSGASTTYKYLSADTARSKGLVYTIKQVGQKLEHAAVASLVQNQHLAVPQADWAAPNYSGGYSYRYGWAPVEGAMLISTGSALDVSNCKIYLGTANPGMITRDTSAGSILAGVAAYSAVGAVTAVGHFAKVVAANRLYVA